MPNCSKPLFPDRIIFLLKKLWTYRKKIVIFSTLDSGLRILPGFYTMLESKRFDQNSFRGGFYPFTSFNSFIDAFPIDHNYKYLYSFVGAINTHNARKIIQDNCAGTGLILDTSNSVAYSAGQTKEIYEAFIKRFSDSLRESKFILCPRGKSPSSIRIFETMKAARVPVIISDDWVMPPQIPWEEFSVFVKEAEIKHIPQILALEEHNFKKKAMIARQIWDDFFSINRLSDTVTDWGLDLLSSSNNSKPNGYFFDLARQICTWTFIRRGLLSQVNLLIKSTVNSESTSRLSH